MVLSNHEAEMLAMARLTSLHARRQTSRARLLAAELLMLLLPSLAASAPIYRREYGYIDTQSGGRLAFVAYLPNGSNRVPAVLQYDTYFGGGSDPEALFLEHGYAFVAVNVPGTGCSHGLMTFLGAAEIAAGTEIIKWISDQRWSNGKVGMWGFSYPGHTSLLIAARHPPHLRAIVAGSVTRSFYYDALYPGGIFNIGLASQWVFAMQPRLAKAGIDQRLSWGDEECRVTVAARAPNNIYDEYAKHPTDDAWWAERSVARAAPTVDVPTMLVHSWQDQLLTSGISVYPLIHAPKQAYAMSGGHSFGQVQPIVMGATIKWFDRYLKDQPNGVERDPKVTILWEVTSPLAGKPTANWLTHHSDWPVPEVQLQTYYFSGNRGLTREIQDERSVGEDRYFFPIGTELTGDDKQFAMAPDPRGSLAYRTPPLPFDLAILGSPAVKLFVSSERTDTDILIALHDIHPNGDTEFLQRGVLRASFRPVGQTTNEGNVTDDQFTTPRPLQPNRIYELSLTLPPLAAMLRKGHALELVVLAPSAIPQPSWALPPIGMPGRNTVYRSSRYPSRLLLPVLSGGAAPAVERPCGSMPFQPCRPAPLTAKSK